MDDWAPVGQQANDWQPVGSPAHRGFMDQLLGINGPRFQLAPERLARGVIGGIMGAAQLPGQYVQEATQPRDSISDSDVSVLSVPSAMNFAGLASPVNPAVRVGDQAIPGVAQAAMVKEKVPLPTTEQLRNSGADYINRGKNSGFEVPGQSIGDWARQQQQTLYDKGVHPVRAGDTFTQLGEVANAPPDSIFTAANLQSLRESLGNTAQNFNPNYAKDQMAATQSIRGLDQWLPNVDPKGVLAGDPAATAALFQRGRGDYSAAMASNKLTGALDKAKTGIVERAEGRAQAANSGLNLDNTIRQKSEALLEKPKEVSGLSPAAMDALENVVQGGPVRNTARYVGNLFGGGGGLGQAVVTGIGTAGGLAAGGGPGAVIGAVTPTAIGVGSKMLANALAKRSLNKADEVIRAGSPLYQEMLAKAPTVPANLGKKAAIAKALLMQAMSGQQQQGN
jgi:hypothetical protein